MKVLHLRSSGGFFGAEGVILNLAEQLQGLGVENDILCLKSTRNPHDELVREAQKKNLNAGTIDCWEMIDFEAIAAIRRHLKTRGINIVHCHDYKADFFGLCAGLFLNVKRVSTNHLWTSETTRLRFYELLDGLLLNFFHKVVAVSERIGDDVRAILLNKAKVRVIYNGIDLRRYAPQPSAVNTVRDDFRISADKKIVGVVGRLSVQKGYGYFLEAAKIVLQKNPKVAFLIVGGGELQAELEDHARRLGIAESVIFAGIQQDMVRIYEALDVFVISSIDEGLPLVLLEALAMQKAVVATNVGGIAKVIHPGQTGRLIPARDVGALAGGIRNLLEDQGQAQRLARNGRELIEKEFSATTMALRYQETYGQVMG